MAALGDGLGYSRLTVPEDGLSQSLQFWGAEAGKRKAAADLANERAKVRDEEKKAKEEAEKKAENKLLERDYKPVFNNFQNQNEQSIAIANKYNSFATDYKIKHKEALDKGDLKEAERIKLEIKKLDSNFARYGEINSSLKDAHAKLFKKKQDGTMSAAYDDLWTSLDYGVNGDLSKVEYDVREDGTFYGKLKKIDDDGVEYIEEIDPEIYMSGVLSNVDKFPFDSSVDTITEKLGTYKNSVFKNGYDVSSAGWTKEAKSFISKHLDSVITDKDVISWAGDNRGAKYNDFQKDPALLAKYRKELKEELSVAALARENREYGKKRNTIEEELALQREEAARRNQPKVGSDEEKLGIRKQNINDIIKTGNVSDFSSGDIEWAGKKYRVVGAKLSADGKNVVLSVQNEKGEPQPSIPVEKTEAGLNELYNAFEKTSWTMDKVQLVEPVVWRNVDAGTPSIFSTKLLNKFKGGQFKGRFFSSDDGSFVDDLKAQYPNLNVSNNYFAEGDISVEGKPIYIDGKTIDEIEKQIIDAAGNKIKTGTSSNNNDPEGLFTN